MAKIGNFWTILNLILLSRTCSDDIKPYMFHNRLNETSLNPKLLREIPYPWGALINASLFWHSAHGYDATRLIQLVGVSIKNLLVISNVSSPHHAWGSCLIRFRRAECKALLRRKRLSENGVPFSVTSAFIGQHFCSKGGDESPCFCLWLSVNFADD